MVARLLPSDASLNMSGVKAFSSYRYDQGINGSVTHNIYLPYRHPKIDLRTWFYSKLRPSLLDRNWGGLRDYVHL